MKNKKRLYIIGGSVLLLILCLIGANIISNTFFSSDAVKFNKLNLAKAKNDVDFHVETIKNETINGDNYLLLRGWAFVHGDTENAEKIYVVFDSDGNTKGVLTKTYFRADIKRYFDSNLKNSKRNNGFEIAIPMNIIKDNKYKLGVYINKNSDKHFSLSNTCVTKIGDKIVSQFVSTPQKVKLPAGGSNIMNGFEIMKEVQFDDQKYFQISGWAFTKDISDKAKTFVVLKSKNNKYVFDTAQITRTGMADYFKSKNKNLDLSGFQALISVADVKDGSYELGIYIEDGEKKDFIMKGIFSTKHGEIFYPFYLSQRQAIALPIPGNQLNCSVESIKEEATDLGDFVKISGWSSPKGKDSVGTKKYVVLKKGTKVMVFDTSNVTRKDVTKVLSNLKLNLDDSGYMANIPKGILEKGDYQIGLYIEKGDSKYLTYSVKHYINK